jgi:hypothetical protein
VIASRPLRRGETQRLRRGITAGLKRIDEFAVCLADAEVLVVLEVFGGTCAVTRAALRDRFWQPLAPADILFGDDFFLESHCMRLVQIMNKEDPDLVILEPPCHRWSRLPEFLGGGDSDILWERRAEHLPLWKFVREVWDHRTARRRLVPHRAAP